MFVAGLKSRPFKTACYGGTDAPPVCLALGLAAGGLLDLGLVLAACSGAWAFGGCCLACGALDLLALDLIGDAGGVCHELESNFL
jgi:hypothetical protein